VDSLGAQRTPVLRAELVQIVGGGAGTSGAPRFVEAAPLEGAAAAAAAHEELMRQPYDERQVGPLQCKLFAPFGPFPPAAGDGLHCG
jgi:hypothetical protein